MSELKTTTDKTDQQLHAADQQVTMATMLQALREAGDAAGQNAATIGSNAANASAIAGDKVTDAMVSTLQAIEKRVSEQTIDVDMESELDDICHHMQDSPRIVARAMLDHIRRQSNLGPEFVLSFIKNQERAMELVRKVNGAELVANTIPVIQTVTDRLTPEKVEKIREASQAISATEELLGGLDDILPTGETCGNFDKFPEITASQAAKVLAKKRHNK